jgi:glycosyltransferase involved in cell wall biosynthesis
MKGAVSGQPTVGFDRRRIGWAQGTGVHRFRDGLHTAIAGMAVAKLALTDAADEARSIQPRRPAAPCPRDIRPRRIDGDTDAWLFRDMFRRAQSRFTLTRQITEITLPDPPDIMHWSCPLPLHVRGAANIYTVHDLIPLEQAHLTSMSGPRLSRLLHQLLPRAAHVLTVSETVRGALSERFGIDRERITCCHEPVGPPVPGSALPAPLAKGGYLLCLGRFEPRKNVARIIDAYLRTPVTLPLVFVGPDGDWPARREHRRVLEMIDRRRIIRLGWQHTAVVDALVTQCHALLMPSLAEGFGLPVIEAMRAGVPTMASCRGAGAEIAGHAALCVDPESVSEIAAGIASLTHDAVLRAELVRKGIERAAQFSPKVFGDRLSALYEKISGRVIRSQYDDEWGSGCA